MVALIDLGNSSIKWGILLDGSLNSTGSSPYPGEQIAQALTNCERAIIGSVVDTRRTEHVIDICRKIGMKQIDVVMTTAEGCGVRNGYRQPERLGVDRWAALVAAHHCFKGPKLVVDCGTALTLDLMDASGQHLGGMIAPGQAMMLSGLQQQSEALRVDDTANTSQIPGKGTREGIDAGIRLMIDGCIDNAWQLAKERMGEKTLLILTGGGGSDYQGRVPDGCIRGSSHLVLLGLALLGGLKLGE